jgi:YD repeat-containing protein
MSFTEKNNNAFSRTDYEYVIDGQISGRTDADGKSEYFVWSGID